MIGAIQEPPSKKDILLSREYQYLAKETARIEDESKARAEEAEILRGIAERTTEENRQLHPLVQEYEKMVGVLGNYLMTASPEWAKMTPAEKLKAYLEGNNNLIRIERANARFAKKHALEISKQSQGEIEAMQGLIRDIKEGTVPKEILEAIIQKVPRATLVLDVNLLITSYNAPARSHPHFELARGMDYKKLFSTSQGFNAFRSEMEKLREGQSFQAYTLLGNGEKRGDYVSIASPIIAQERLFGYDVSIRPETKMEWVKRKVSLTKKVVSEIELNALPELGEA